MNEEILKLIKESKLSKEVTKSLESALPKLSRRGKIAVKHILEHGTITTENLEKIYGYKHPPRAIRDVREAGIPLEKFPIESSDGRQIASYKFGDLTEVSKDKLGERKTFSKKFKADLYKFHKGKCAICLTTFESRYLQIDHKIPYEVAGESKFSEKTRKIIC